MLSYQHIYHAGNKADLHKHAAIVRILGALTAQPDPVLYIETHAGRGLYDLRAAEAEKTGEAKQGWLQVAQDKNALLELPKPYVDAVRACNGGALKPFYPGSPKIAAHVLRAQDKICLYDLHPAEFSALQLNMKGDPRIRLEKRDGLEAALAAAKLYAKTHKHALVLIDPSYEIKPEYETIPEFILKFHASFPAACILLWVPMLPALRHEKTRELVRSAYPEVYISEEIWGDPASGRGMFGSLLLGINLPPGSAA